MYVAPALTAINSPYLSKINTGLGNTLFQIASVYGIAKKTGRVPAWNNVLLLSDLLQTKFGYNHRHTIFRNVLTCVNVPFEQINIIGGVDNYYNYDNSLIQSIINSSNNIEVLGYLENTTYFNDYKQEVIQLLSPDEDSLNMIKDTYPILFDNSYTTIAIHFRGNEYLTLRGSPSFIRLKSVILHLTSIHTNPVFLLFTDDCQHFDFSVFEGVNYIVMRNTTNYIDIDYIDLWTFSLCKHAIVSHSTFAFWGAYLNSHPDALFYLGYTLTHPAHNTLNIQNV
jgi:hypothetical protein